MDIIWNALFLQGFLSLAIAYVFVLSGNHNCIAETVRSLGKPSLQTLFLTAAPVNDSDTTYTGVFLAPPDTQLAYGGKIEGVTKGKNNVVAAMLSNNNSNNWRTLALYSESKREALYIFTNYSPKFRTQESFPESRCDVGIEKIQRDTHTEYKATARNCAENETLMKRFMGVIRDKSGKEFELSSRDISTQAPYPEYLVKYLDTYYTNDENGIYYAILNYSAMEADGVSLIYFWFELSVQEEYGTYSEEDIASYRFWSYILEMREGI